MKPFTSGCSSLPALPAALYFSFLYRRPWFMSLHGDIEESFTISRREKGSFTRISSTTIMGLSGTRDKLPHHYAFCLWASAPPKKMRSGGRTGFPLWDSGIREETFSTNILPDTVGLPLPAFVCGRFFVQEGCRHSVPSACDAQGKRYGCAAHLVGSGERFWLEGLAKTLGIGDLIEFTGFLTYGEPLFAKIRASDLLVVPSLGSEGWNRTITEANSQGLPIVASDINSLGIAIQDWSCGWWCNRGIR